MNYGHSFGHAIETATNYKIPHGIAITIGMDIANFVSKELKILDSDIFYERHVALSKNFKKFNTTQIKFDLLFKALSKDKKNVGNKLKLILPNQNGKITIGLYDKNKQLKNAIKTYLQEVRSS